MRIYDWPSDSEEEVEVVDAETLLDLHRLITAKYAEVEDDGLLTIEVSAGVEDDSTPYLVLAYIEASELEENTPHE